MNSSIEQIANKLIHQTVYDLRCSLYFCQDLAVLKRALELTESGQGGYGSGKTAAKMIKVKINKIQRKKP